ncbi:MAG TPA: glycine dehydrogenase, partial [Candidatus Omnitrophota bacterium]|nr:glycine dehydrogenase [Candidatus Omnitrophota bacterium]
LREKIAGIKGFEVAVSQPIFNEFVVKSPVPFAQIEKKLAAERIFPGVALETYYPELRNRFLVCATETKTREDLDRFAEALAKC